MDGGQRTKDHGKTTTVDPPQGVEVTVSYVPRHTRYHEGYWLSGVCRFHGDHTGCGGLNQTDSGTKSEHHSEMRS